MAHLCLSGLFCGVLAAIRRVLADILRRIKGVFPATKARSLSNVVKQIDTLLEAASAAQEQATRASNANSGKPQYSLTDKQASAIIETMKANAEVAPQVELTPENWVAEFGVDGVVTTPIGEVKMGERQYEKMQQRGRNTKLGMVKPTLSSPDIIIEEYSKRNDGKVAERNSSFVYIKAFTNADGTRDYMFTSVSNQRNGIEIIVSNQEKETPRVKRLLKEGRLAYISKATLPSEFTASAQGDQSTIPSEVSSSNNKDTTSSPNMQEEGAKFSLQQLDVPYLEAVERGDMETAQRMVLEAAKLAMPDTKIVDANGEPKVVYHQTNATEYVNVETGERWDDLDWMERAEWDERDDWDEYWQERDFYTFSRANARTTQEFDGFFFAPEYDEYHEYGDRTISAFLDIKNPASRDDYNIDSSKNNAGQEERLRLQQEGYDGVIREVDGVVWEYVAFEPNQIKSADPVTYDDNGNVIPLSERFNPAKEDVRYSLGQPTDEDVTFDNFFERTSALFTQIIDTPTTKPDYISRSGSTYWYGEDERGKYVIRRSDHWSAIVRDEEDAKAFNAKPDDFNNIASCYWALDMRTYKPQSFAPINKETVRTINYNSGSKDLNIVFNDGKTTRRRGVEPRDMRKYFELRNSGDISAANGYVVDMVNELYSAAPMPTVQTAKAYLDEFTKWSGESEQKSEQKRKLYSVQNQPTFYSNAEYAVRGIKQEKATPEQWLKMIEKSGGLKAGEDKWLGLSDWLKASDKKTLTKDEVLQYIAENDIQIEEVEYGDVEDSVRFKELHIEYTALYYEYGRNSERAFEVMLDNYGDDFGIAFEAVGDELWVRDSEAAKAFVYIKSVNDTRLQYTTDGLTHKREIALVVPTIEPWNTSDNIHFGDAGWGRAVAWIRFGVTTDADVKRVLVIDEIQSKRHQEGREKGYISVEEKATIDAIRAQKEELSKKRRDWDYRTGEAWRQFQAGDITEQEYNRLWDTQFDAEKKQLDEIERGINSEINVYDSFTKIPAAPFEKNWAELAMKRMLRYAAENGFDKVAWTTGDQQSERYNLSKIVDYIDAERNVDGTYNINVATNDDSHYVQENNIPEKRLSELVGKDIAYGIISSIENSDDNKAHIEADDMTIGGAGMKAFYDQMLPSFVRKYAKKWGATVGEVTMPDLEENNTMHSVDVTPAMRESVMQGQPKFSLRSDVADILTEYDTEGVKYGSMLDVADGIETVIAESVENTSELENILNDFRAAQDDARKWGNRMDSGGEEEFEKALRAYVENVIKPIGIGEFGPIYTQFKGNPKEAVKFLMSQKNGEAIGALSHKDIGEIDLVWGEEGTGHSNGYGLSKLAKFHPEVLDNLQPILDDMEVVSRNPNRVNLENSKYKAAVRLTWNNERKNWLLTAFEKRNSAIDNTTGTGETALSDKQNDTATLQSTVSNNKDTTSSPNIQEEGAKFSLQQLDAPYLEAVERGDMATAQRMVLEAAERTGYLSDTSYQGSLAFNGAAPMANAYFDTKEQRKDAWDNEEYDGTMSLGDYADNNIDTNDLEWQLSDRGNYRRAEDYTKESIDNINNAINGGNHKITIYRAVPNSVEEGTVRNGDWVTPSRKYAEYHIELQDWVGGRIIEQEVDIDNIWWNGDDINEWGYDDGSNYGYRNTPNNRKLLDPVTYDDNGNVIPLSERFNPEKEDVRYSISESNAPFSTTEAGKIAEQMRADGALPSEIYARTGWWWDAKGRMRSYPRDKQPRAAKIVELQKAEGTYDERTSFGNIEAENVGKQGLGSTTEEQVRLWLKNRHLVAIDNIRKKYKMYRDTARRDLQEKQRRLQLYLLVVVAELL